MELLFPNDIFGTKFWFVESSVEEDVMVAVEGPGFDIMAFVTDTFDNLLCSMYPCAARSPFHPT